MRRGQRAAQPPKLGAWKLAGVMVNADRQVRAVYERFVSHMMPDGTWMTSSETTTLPLPDGARPALKDPFAALGGALAEYAPQPAWVKS